MEYNIIVPIDNDTIILKEIIMVKKIIALSAVALLAFSGCSAKKAEVVKPKVTKAVKVAEKAQKKAKVVVKKKATKKLSGVASVVPASEFFK